LAIVTLVSAVVAPAWIPPPVEEAPEVLLVEMVLLVAVSV
jgi:hypothetical protein